MCYFYVIFYYLKDDGERTEEWEGRVVSLEDQLVKVYRERSWKPIKTGEI